MRFNLQFRIFIAKISKVLLYITRKKGKSWSLASPEIIGGSMKKGIIVLLITVLVATSVFALDFHGNFRAGYKFDFGDSVKISDVNRLGGLSGRFYITSGAEGEGWTLNLWAPVFDCTEKKGYYGYYSPIAALLTVDYSAVLGLPEDASVQLMLGDNDGFSIYVPYLDPTASSYNYISSEGSGIVTGLAFGYKNYSIAGAIDPDEVSGIVYANADFDFVSVGAGAQFMEDVLDVEAGFVFDIAKVAKLDNASAKISALYQFAKESEDKSHDLYVAVTGGYDALSAYAEFIAALTSKNYDLNAGLSYALTDSFSVGADGAFEFDGDKAMSGAGWAKYKLNGVTYQAWVGYSSNVYAKAQVTLNF